jgi:hypothetical protein
VRSNTANGISRGNAVAYGAELVRLTGFRMEGNMPTIAQWFFKAAVVFLLLGILMGLQMSISGNHNVIGWVTSAIFGGYYALNPAKAETRLASIHFWAYLASVVVMVPSLYLLYIGYPAVEPALAIASLTAFAAVVVFAVVVFTPARATLGTAGAVPAE